MINFNKQNFYDDFLNSKNICNMFKESDSLLNDIKKKNIKK